MNTTDTHRPRACARCGAGPAALVVDIDGAYACRICGHAHIDRPDPSTLDAIRETPAEYRHLDAPIYSQQPTAADAWIEPTTPPALPTPAERVAQVVTQASREAADKVRAQLHRRLAAGLPPHATTPTGPRGMFAALNRAGISQNELARRAGLSSASISRAFNGSTPASRRETLTTTHDIAGTNITMSLCGLRADTPEGADWIAENVDTETAPTWNGFIVCEARYIDAIIEGARADGLSVGPAIHTNT